MKRSQFSVEKVTWGELIHLCEEYSAYGLVDSVYTTEEFFEYTNENLPGKVGKDNIDEVIELLMMGSYLLKDGAEYVIDGKHGWQKAFDVNLRDAAKGFMEWMDEGEMWDPEDSDDSPDHLGFTNLVAGKYVNVFAYTPNRTSTEKFLDFLPANGTPEGIFLVSNLEALTTLSGMASIQGLGTAGSRTTISIPKDWNVWVFPVAGTVALFLNRDFFTINSDEYTIEDGGIAFLEYKPHEMSLWVDDAGNIETRKSLNSHKPCLNFEMAG